MALGDSLHSAIEDIWDAIRSYSYSIESKEELVEALTRLRWALYLIDNSGLDLLLTMDDIRALVLKQWDIVTEQHYEVVDAAA